jgi:hypothetical protein
MDLNSLDYSFHSWAAVRLNPLGTSDTLVLVVIAPNEDDDNDDGGGDDESGAVDGMGIGRGNRSTQRTPK